ncbi:MAG: cytochrome c3 family protein [Chloroflexi bacterium]|nr:cytochrome c3 family protein [Chloroflexota bacterium]
MGLSNRWRLRIAGALLGIVIVLIIVVVFVPRALGFGQAPEQPIAFTHKTHVEVVGTPCTFCHRGAETGAVAGIPPVEQCMFCHRALGRDNPEVQKVIAAWAQNEPINWMRVHRLPDSVHFVHDPHIRSGLTCATCHGDVESMVQVRQVRSLKMGDCLACHREREAPTECSFCHY